VVKLASAAWTGETIELVWLNNVKGMVGLLARDVVPPGTTDGGFTVDNVGLKALGAGLGFRHLSANVIIGLNDCSEKIIALGSIGLLLVVLK
jgi:hypothetical protein